MPTATPRRSTLPGLALAALLPTLAATECAAQTVAGASITTHASGVPGPVRLAFASDGTLFCGRDVALTGTATPQFVTRVGSDGSPVAPYGNAPTPDPDVVVVDDVGVVSGVAGSVLTGGIKVANTIGSVSAIRPDGAVVELWTSTAWINPVALAFHPDGRFVFADYVSRSVWQSVGGAAPVVLCTLPGSARPNYLTIAPDGRIFICDSIGRIYAFAANGALLNANVATLPSLAALAFGRGGGFGSDLYALRTGNGTLLRIAADGTVTTLGTGLGTTLTDLTCGPDGRLYWADFGGSRIQVATPNAAHEVYGTGCHLPAPLSLTAAPAPALSPATVVTYSIGGVPEFAPGSGLHLSTLFLSVNPLPAGIDLVGILTTHPGCRVHLATLDVNLGTALTLAPTNDVPLLFSLPTFAPGNVIAAQAVALFDPTFPLPNGEAGGLLLSNGVRTTTQLQ